jgi:hypothetical protein
MIPHVADSRLSGTICAAIESTSRFDAVTNDFAATMGAARGERVNRAFKTVEHMRAAAHPHLEALVILVSAHFTLSHLCSSSSKSYTEIFSKNTRDVFQMRIETAEAVGPAGKVVAVEVDSSLAARASEI